MLRFLLDRPIAVIMSLIALLSISTLAYFNLPVSLLPEADVPEISIVINYPNSSQEDIESNILKPIRTSMLTISGLKSVESIAQSEAGFVTLYFDYEAAMDLAYIEVNEKIDRLSPIFPTGLNRPVVIKATTSDIPIIRVQVIPKSEEDLNNASELSLNILKRRIEQLEGVGLVDINGLQKQELKITPNRSLMTNLRISDQDLISSIQATNLKVGAISVRDGNYSYFLRMISPANSIDELRQLPIRIGEENSLVKLEQVADVTQESETSSGFHLLNNKPGIVINVHKQAQAKLPDLIPKLKMTISQFQIDYPLFEFSLTRDQSQLLTMSIQNLSQAVIWGGAFAFGVLFLFIRGWREPLIMGIVLPLSLIMTFSLFYIFNISLNIISISGLVLGLGMLVDNSIVVIDNIILKRREGLILVDCCVLGTMEVMVPLVSSALTNVAIFLPLIFISGLTGTLFFDQAVSVASILFVSLLCTFIVVPLIYSLFFKESSRIQDDSLMFQWLKNKYKQSFQYVWSHKKTTLLIFFSFVPIAVIFLWRMPLQGFPEIDRNETLLKIDWNSPINADQNKLRVVDLLKNYNFQVSEADVGTQQFVVRAGQNSTQHADIYLLYKDPNSKIIGDSQIENYLSNKFPIAKYSLGPAPNTFEQLFSSSKPFLEARLRDIQSKRPIGMQSADSLFKSIPFHSQLGKGFEMESIIEITMNRDKIAAYGITPAAIVSQLQFGFGEYLIADLVNYGTSMKIVIGKSMEDFDATLQKMMVRSIEGIQFPLRDFINVSFGKAYKFITADDSGLYQSINLNETENPNQIKNELIRIAKSKNLIVDFDGRWFDYKTNLSDLTIILCISILLMYFILTIEFESLVQPFLVLASFPIGFAGSIILLGIVGGSVNIMSGIGLVVVLGILDNDAILKVDRINRLRKTLPLESAIFQAGKDRFKPIVMNTCTNVLALTPIIFASGLGADLQRPVAITTIGGLIVGTFTALYFVPIVYWYTNKKQIT